MQHVRLDTTLDEYHRLVAIGTSQDPPISVKAAAQRCWSLGLAAAEAGWQPKEVPDLQPIVIAGALKGVA